MIFERIDRGFDKSILSKEEEIEMNKLMSKAMTEVRKKIKTGKCMYCGKTVNSYCNSHNVPRYCLENIGNDGEVASPNSILGLPKMGIPIGKENIGINESGAFFLICRECDSSIFQEYENPVNYNEGRKPSQRMLAQIAIKNYLKFIYKRKMEIAMAEHILQSVKDTSPYYQLQGMEAYARRKVSIIDLDAYTEEFERAKKYATSDNKTGFYLFYYKLLNYVVPIAVQVPIALSIDLEGQVVNDLYSADEDYKLFDLHLCVFPQRTTTAVLLFVEEGDKRYRKFRKQFQKLDEEAKLGVINYIIFLYTEDYFMSKKLGQMIDFKELNEIANTTFTIWHDTPTVETEALSDKYSLAKWKSIPNLLSEQYKIR